MNLSCCVPSMCSASAGEGRHVSDSSLSSRICFGLYFFHHRHWRPGFSLGSVLLNVLFFQHLLSGCALSHGEKPLLQPSPQQLQNLHRPSENNIFLAVSIASSLAAIHTWSDSRADDSHVWVTADFSRVLRSPLLFSAGLRGVPLAVLVKFSEGTAPFFSKIPGKGLWD